MDWRHTANSTTDAIWQQGTLPNDALFVALMKSTNNYFWSFVGVSWLVRKEYTGKIMIMHKILVLIMHLERGGSHEADLARTATRRCCRIGSILDRLLWRQDTNRLRNRPRDNIYGTLLLFAQTRRIVRRWQDGSCVTSFQHVLGTNEKITTYLFPRTRRLSRSMEVCLYKAILRTAELTQHDQSRRLPIFAVLFRFITADRPSIDIA